MPRVIGTCMVSNEADIIEPFVRHNLSLLDGLVVLDHASVDSTFEILGALAREGLPLIVLQDRDPAFHQGGRQTYMARKYLPELQADFSFALDADELIRVPDRRALDAALARVPAGSCAVVRMQNYFGAALDVAGDPPRSLTRRLRHERAPAHKVVLSRAFLEDPAAQVALGNHAAVSVASGHVRPLPHVLLEGVLLAHFPVRSAEQVAKKAVLGWLAHRLTRPERFVDSTRGHVPASHWRDLFAQLASGQRPIDESLRAEAIALYAGGGRVEDRELVEDPLPVAYELRHSAGASLSPLAMLATWTDRLVSEMNAARDGGVGGS